MAWRSGFNHQAITNLGTLTARLIRMVALQQVRRSQAQLTALGVKSDFSQMYEDFARKESTKYKASGDDVLLIVTTNESTF